MPGRQRTPCALQVLANVFYENSTRTSASFAAAMQRLGGSVLQISSSTSSAKKGESLGDTIRCLEQYADVVVLRHPARGSAAEAAAATEKPLLNAGDGVGEHPTQALLDLYTIMRERGVESADGLTVTMLGDLRNGRTVHSLAVLLTLFDVKLRFVSPSTLRMPRHVMDDLRRRGADVAESDTLDGVLAEADVLYVTRVQRERFASPEEYDAVAGANVITPEVLAGAKRDLVLMHPLPRVDEIAVACDADPRAAYFRQMENGMFVRMALLGLALGVKPPASRALVAAAHVAALAAIVGGAAFVASRLHRRL